jgi:hypothetical protein
MAQGDEQLRKGITAYKMGRKEVAGRFIRDSLQLNPKNERAWLWLSGFVDSDEQRRYCLERVLALNPNNEIARVGLKKLSAESQEAERPTPPPEPLEAPPPQPAESLEPASITVHPAVELAPIDLEATKRRSRLLVVLGFPFLMILMATLGYLFLLPVLSSFGPLEKVISQFSPSQKYTSEEESAVLNAVYENIAAANSENIDRYMASLHSQSQNYEGTRERLEILYQDYDLTAIISEIELFRYTTAEARVHFTLETRKREGPDFRENRISGTFILRPEDGQWKLYDQVVSRFEYLD